MTSKSLSEKLLEYLIEKGLTLTTAESCTGGWIASTVVDVPGVSAIFHEGYIAYSAEAKERLLGVNPKTIEEYGVVSAQTAMAMAKGAAQRAKADIALSSTGVAGPSGGSESHPVGEVYLGCWCLGKGKAVRIQENGNRKEIREKAVSRAFDLLNEMLMEESG